LPLGPPWLNAARVAVEDAIMAKHLQATTAVRFWLCKCLAACFRFAAVGHHLYGTLKAFHAAANHKASTPLCRAAVVAAVGELCWAHGGRVGSLGGDCVGVCARQLGLRDLGLRRAAMDALAAVLTGGVPLWVSGGGLASSVYACSRDAFRLAWTTWESA
jgi:hypothetical protein